MQRSQLCLLEGERNLPLLLALAIARALALAYEFVLAFSLLVNPSIEMSYPE